MLLTSSCVANHDGARTAAAGLASFVNNVARVICMRLVSDGTSRRPPRSGAWRSQSARGNAGGARWPQSEAAGLLQATPSSNMVEAARNLARAFFSAVLRRPCRGEASSRAGNPSAWQPRGRAAMCCYLWWSRGVMLLRHNVPARHGTGGVVLLVQRR